MMRIVSSRVQFLGIRIVQLKKMDVSQRTGLLEVLITYFIWNHIWCINQSES